MGNRFTDWPYFAPQFFLDVNKFCCIYSECVIHISNNFSAFDEITLDQMNTIGIE